MSVVLKWPNVNESEWDMYRVPVGWWNPERQLSTWFVLAGKRSVRVLTPAGENMPCLGRMRVAWQRPVIPRIWWSMTGRPIVAKVYKGLGLELRVGLEKLERLGNGSQDFSV